MNEQEIWEAACVKVGIKPFYVATSHGRKVYLSRAMGDSGIEWPALGDAGAVVAMLEWCFKYCNGWQWDAIRIAVASGKFNKLDGAGEVINLPPENRIALAIAAAVNEVEP